MNLKELMNDHGQGLGAWQNNDERFTEVIQRLSHGWLVTHTNGLQEVFDEFGRLIQVKTLGGYQQFLSYNEQGQLIKVTDSFQAEIAFIYNQQGLLDHIINPEGQITRYRYHLSQGHAVLSKVIHPDDTSSLEDNPYMRYWYEDERFPIAITGVSNELGLRLHNMAYDYSGRAILSQLGEQGRRTEVVFLPNKLSKVINSLGRETTYSFNEHNLPIGITGHATASCAGSNQQYRFYDDRGNIESRIDWEGHITRYEYNARNLETQRIEAEGTTVERVIKTQWHKDFAMPVKVIEPGLTTVFKYNDRGLLIKQIQIDTSAKKSLASSWFSTEHKRVTRYQYNDQGLLTLVDGPRKDVKDITQFFYDERGNRIRSVNALGHQAETLAFDESGRPLLVKDANGLETQLNYNGRGWLETQTVKGPQGVQATTSYEYVHSGNYEGEGQVSKVTLPNGDFVLYEYDTAYRLTATETSAGERIEYTLDLEGNRVAETTFDANGKAVRTHQRVFDELSRLLSSIGADQQTTQFSYDKNGNRVGMIDPLNNATTYAFDALNRLVSITDANQGVIGKTYDAQDRVTSITDQRGLTTEYRYNGFGEKIAQISPDTGETQYRYNRAGLLIGKTDARGVETEFDYDAIGRVVHVHYPAANDEDIYYAYDKPATKNRYG